MAKMTLLDLKMLDSPMVSCAVAAQFLCTDPYALNRQCRFRPEFVPVPFYITGKQNTHVKFPRLALIAWLEGELYKGFGEVLEGLTPKQIEEVKHFAEYIKRKEIEK